MVTLSNTLLRYHLYVYPVPVVALMVIAVPAQMLAGPAGLSEAVSAPMVTTVAAEVALHPPVAVTTTV